MKDDEFYEETWQVWYFIKSHAYHFTENFDKKMVEFHVDMFAEYKYLPCSSFCGNLIICPPPPGSNPIKKIGQDEVIFRSSQLNTYFCGIDWNQTIILEGYGSLQRVGGFQVIEFGFGIYISKY